MPNTQIIESLSSSMQAIAAGMSYEQFVITGQTPDNMHRMHAILLARAEQGIPGYQKLSHQDKVEAHKLATEQTATTILSQAA